jgi:DNA-binding protein HU-beta
LVRKILEKTTVTIPAHYVPSFKPAKEFVDAVKEKVKVAEND